MNRSNGQTGILVTGATGNVGSDVCRHFCGTGRSVYGAVTPAKLKGDKTSQLRIQERLHGAEPRALDYKDSSTWGEALNGVGKVFLVRPPHISKIRRDMYPFMAHMRDRGIGHVVFLSVQGAENNSIVPHHKVEQAILQLGMPYTFIRPSFFMQNLTTTHLPEVREESRIFVPAGNGVTNFIDVRDIADVIAVVLLDDSHKNRAYTITGTDSYSYYEVAERLSRILGRSVQYQPARLLPFLRYHISRGRTLKHGLVMYALYSVTRFGKAGVATDTFQQITGRQPRSLDQFIADHRDLLAPAS